MIALVRMKRGATRQRQNEDADRKLKAVVIFRESSEFTEF